MLRRLLINNNNRIASASVAGSSENVSVVAAAASAPLNFSCSNSSINSNSRSGGRPMLFRRQQQHQQQFSTTTSTNPLLSSSPSPASVTVTQTSASSSISRLENLRQQLKQEEDRSTLHDFVAPTSDDLRPSQRKKARPRARKPSWLKAVPATSSKYKELRSTVRELGLATVCEEARCPNIGECWSGSSEKGGSGATATIMIMGDTCTRGCSFCSVKTSKNPSPLDPEEPEKVATAISKFGGLDYIVLTSVDRDDLDDQGSNHFASVITKLKEYSPKLLVEALTPDFSGNQELIKNVASSGLDVYAHNIETVERLTRRVRDYRATYKQSLNVLEYVKELSLDSTEDSTNCLTKTSIMLGLGETDDEIQTTLKDLRSVDCDVVTFGQYLQPTKKHIKVKEYVTPEKFEEWKLYSEQLGFTYVASGPLVRSSYKAGEYFLSNLINNKKKKQETTNKEDDEALVA